MDNVTFLFDDGSNCKIMRVDPKRLVHVSRSLLGDTYYAYGRYIEMMRGSAYPDWNMADKNKPCGGLILFYNSSHPLLEM